MPRPARRREPTCNTDSNIDIDEPRQLRPKAQKTIAQVFSFVYLKQPDGFHQQFKRNEKASQKATPCIEPPV